MAVLIYSSDYFITMLFKNSDVLPDDFAKHSASKPSKKMDFARKRRIHITNKRFQQFPAFESVQGVLIENNQK